MRASTDSRHRLYVQAAIDYIADRLDERVRLEDLSRHIGLSPSRYRQGVRSRRRESTEPFEVVQRPPSRVACVRFVGPYDEANDAYDHLRHWAEPLGLLEHRNMLGIYWDDQTITAPEKTRSDAAIEVPDDLRRELARQNYRRAALRAGCRPEGRRTCTFHGWILVGR